MTRYFMSPYGSVKEKEGHALNEGSDMPPWWPFDDNQPRRFDLRTKKWLSLEGDTLPDPKPMDTESDVEKTSLQPAVRVPRVATKAKSREYEIERERQRESYAQAELTKQLQGLERMLNQLYAMVEQSSTDVDVYRFVRSMVGDSVKQWTHHRPDIPSPMLERTEEARSNAVSQYLETWMASTGAIEVFDDGFHLLGIPVTMVGSSSKGPSLLFHHGGLMTNKRDIWQDIFAHCEERAKQHHCRWITRCASPFFQAIHVEFVFHSQHEGACADLDKYVPMLEWIQSALYRRRMTYRGPARLSYTAKWAPGHTQQTLLDVRVKGVFR